MTIGIEHRPLKLPANMMRNTAVQSKRKIRLSSTLVATYTVGVAAIAYNGSNKVCYVCSSHGEILDNDFPV